VTDLTLTGLRVVLEVARTGSFSAAAERLGYTQSAVSRQVAVTEKAVGTPLFARHARGTRPTPAGEALARHAGQVIDHRTLLREVWGPSYGDERNYLRTFIQRLRVKLEADPKRPEIIVTAGSRGYRFGAPSAI